MLFIGGTVVAAGGSYGADAPVEDEKVAVVSGRSSGRFVGLGFMATEGLEVRV